MPTIDLSPVGAGLQQTTDQINAVNDRTRQDQAFQANLRRVIEEMAQDKERFAWEKQDRAREEELRGVLGEAAAFQAGLARPNFSPDDPQARYAAEIETRKEIAARLAKLSPKHADQFLSTSLAEMEDRQSGDAIDQLVGEIEAHGEQGGMAVPLPGPVEGNVIDLTAQAEEVKKSLKRARALPPAQRMQALQFEEQAWREMLARRAETQANVAATQGRLLNWGALEQQRRVAGDHDSADAMAWVIAQASNDPGAPPGKYDLLFAAAMGTPKARAELEKMSAELGWYKAREADEQASAKLKEEQARASRFEHSIPGKIATGLSKKLGSAGRNGAGSGGTTGQRHTERMTEIERAAELKAEGEGKVLPSLDTPDKLKRDIRGGLKKEDAIKRAKALGIPIEEWEKMLGG